MSVRINDNDLLLNGKVQNLNRYLLGKGMLRSDLAVTADNFSTEHFLEISAGLVHR